ncbi:MAG: glycosyltransferase [Lentisphaerae bacterium]|nr:glycosyltransferase [Lentisphaerota bacterium]
MNREGDFSVYCVAGCDICTTFEYRVLQKQEQLALAGIACTVAGPKGQRAIDIDEFRRCDVLLLYREAAGNLVDLLAREARSRGMPVVFDIDDLLFEPEHAFQVDALTAMRPAEVAAYYQSLWRYRAALEASDYVITSSEFLAGRARALGKSVWVHPNGLSQWMMAESGGQIAQRRQSGPADRVIIGYGSGTPTHRKDLEAAGRALARILAAHPQVDLHLAGPLHLNDPRALPDCLRLFVARIKHLPLTSWRAWLATLSGFDINLAPLEMGIPFCEAKSAIKFTEAAVVGVPTVASRTAGYAAAMRDGETGFLADGPDAWAERLDQLVRDPALRRKMGDAAREEVIRHYAPEVLSRQLVETLNAMRQDYVGRRASAQAAEPRVSGTPLVLNWIIPDPTPGSGGCTNIVRILNLLASFGHRINVYVMALPLNPLPPMTDIELRAYIGRHFAPINGSVFKWSGEALAPSDAVFLTLWSTAYRFRGLERTTGKVFYFVQDWEPYFYAMGEEYLMAEQTYRMGYSCITLGQWLTGRLRDAYGADAEPFDMAVDRSIYYPRPGVARSVRRICFYARPSTPRRLFALGVKALSLVHEWRPDVEIVFFGCADTDLHVAPISFPYRNLGVLKEGELAELFSSVTAGVVLSSTNCSLLPLEMMACKCAVVDLNLETVQGVMEHEGNALLADPTPEGIAGAVRRLLDDEPLRERLVARAFDQVQQLSWERSARHIEDIVLRKLPSGQQLTGHARWTAPANLPATAALPAHEKACLDALERERHGWRWALRAGVQGWRRRELDWERKLFYGGRRVQVLGEMTAGRVIGQSFVAHFDGMHRIDVLVCTWGDVHTGDLVMHLHDVSEDDRVVAEVRVSASLMADDTYVSFCFSPQAMSRGKAYRATFETPGGASGNAVGLWAYPDVDVSEARLSVDGGTGRGQLVFGLYYQDQVCGERGGRPLTQVWTQQLTAFGYLLAPLHVYGTEGWRGMCREMGAVGRRALRYWSRRLRLSR